MRPWVLWNGLLNVVILGLDPRIQLSEDGFPIKSGMTGLLAMTALLSYPRMRVSMPLKRWIPDQVGNDRAIGNDMALGNDNTAVIPANAGIHAFKTIDSRSSRE
jgi:hypothetical protein